VATIGDLASQVLQRVEEDPANPIFWTYEEAYWAVQEAINEATLLTGQPEVGFYNFTLTKDTRFFTLPTFGIGILSMTGTGFIAKESIFSLDVMKPTWEQDVGAAPKYWFSFGINQFGIYPKLTLDSNVMISFISAGYTYPFSPTTQVLIPQEYYNGIIDYAASTMKIKEGGTEFAQGLTLYQKFLDDMSKLNAFADRIDGPRFSKTFGVDLSVSPWILSK